MRSRVRKSDSARNCSYRLDPQSGIAIVFALIVVFVLSALAAGMMFTTQAEIWTTSTYKTTTQARYIAEAGVQQAINYLLQSATTSKVQTLVATIATDPNCTTVTNPLAMPVTCNGNLVYLQSSSTDANLVNSITISPVTPKRSTYPFLNTPSVSEFQSKVSDSSSFSTLNNNGGGQYSVVAQLLSVRTNQPSGVAQSWKLISIGSVPSINGVSRVQVVETFEILTKNGSGGPPPTILVSGGVQAGSNACPAISLSGGSQLKSYDSTKINPGTIPSSLNSSGSTIVTQGSVNFNNGTVYGSLETTRTGDTFGTSCPSSTSAVNVTGNPNSQSVLGVPGITASGSGWGTPPGGGVYSIIAPTDMSIFNMPVPVISMANLNTGACTDPVSGWSGTSRCNGGSDQGGTTNQITMVPNPGSNYGNAVIGADITLNITQSGYYNFNSLHVGNGGSIVVAPGIDVAINITGKNTDGVTDLANPLIFDGYGLMTKGDNPSSVIFQYAGSGLITYTASGTMVGVINAPNANFTFSGAGVVYGAILTHTASFSGSGTLEYDTHLGVAPIKLPPTGGISYYARLSQFSWSAF